MKKEKIHYSLIPIILIIGYLFYDDIKPNYKIEYIDKELNKIENIQKLAEQKLNEQKSKIRNTENNYWQKEEKTYQTQQRKNEKLGEQIENIEAKKNEKLGEQIENIEARKNEKLGEQIENIEAKKNEKLGEQIENIEAKKIEEINKTNKLISKETPINLTNYFNVYNGITTDGNNYTSGALDGLGYSYSVEFLMKNNKWDGTNFIFGKPNNYNAISANGQSIELFQGKYTYLKILATSVNGNVKNGKIVVKYTDGDMSVFIQNMSDWYYEKTQQGESKAIIMNYRNDKNNNRDNRTFNLYGYSFYLDNNKVVQRIILPHASSMRILAMTLVP